MRHAVQRVYPDLIGRLYMRPHSFTYMNKFEETYQEKLEKENRSFSLLPVRDETVIFLFLTL